MSSTVACVKHVTVHQSEWQRHWQGHAGPKRDPGKGSRGERKSKSADEWQQTVEGRQGAAYRHAQREGRRRGASSRRTASGQDKHTRHLRYRPKAPGRLPAGKAAEAVEHMHAVCSSCLAGEQVTAYSDVSLYMIKPGEAIGGWNMLVLLGSRRRTAGAPWYSLPMGHERWVHAVALMTLLWSSPHRAPDRQKQATGSFLKTSLL